MSNIDIEYDRMVKDSQSYYEKELSCECRSREGNKLCYDKCCQIIIDEIEKGVAKNSTKKEKESDIIRKAVRPDVIVHNRNKVGVENNGLVVEFKKYDNNKVAFDMAKLYYFTCPESKTLQYQLGAMVRLFPEYAYVGFVGERKILSGCKVCANRVEAVKRAEIEKCLLERVI